MTVTNKRYLIWGSLGVLVMIGLAFAFAPRALPVDLGPAVMGPMMTSVSDEGETRVVDVFVVSAPITGQLRRIEREPGEAVVANETILAEIEPSEPDLLDPRTEAEAEALLSAAVSAEALARSEFDKAEAELKFAESELERTRELAQKGTVSERELEAGERAFATSRAALGVAQANMEVRKFELERARALLMSPAEMTDRRAACACVNINSPVDGRVLRVLRESEGFVRAGEGLVEIGDPGRLEIVVDLLSTDAVKVRPGFTALIENWGGEQALDARVRRVDPFGFTKVSALGIEEQRVNVVLDILSPTEEWQNLGHGYQVDVRIVLWQGDNVLKVPMTALFRDGSDWALFVREDGRAVRRTVTLGKSTPSEAQIVAGVREGEEVIVFPSEGVDDGVRIVAR